jgi:hypothetical protein
MKISKYEDRKFAAWRRGAPAGAQVFPDGAGSGR